MKCTMRLYIRCALFRMTAIFEFLALVGSCILPYSKYFSGVLIFMKSRNDPPEVIFVTANRRRCAPTMSRPRAMINHGSTRGSTYLEDHPTISECEALCRRFQLAVCFQPALTNGIHFGNDSTIEGAFSLSIE